MDLTQEEIGLLRQLEEGPRTLSGNKQRGGMKRLVTAGWVTERALNISDAEYTITDAGRATLTHEVSSASIPVEDLNASNDE